MSRLDAAFGAGPIFMPYFPIGYPDYAVSLDVLEALAKNGADLIEVGLAFSDPLADGPVIQQATQIALQNGITLKRALEGVAELRRRGVSIPLVLMGYYNPILAFGLERFAGAAGRAGSDGFIVPDLPPEEAGELESAAGDLPLIRMLAPTSPPERVARVAQSGRGFIYLVSVAGVTGARSQLPPGLAELVARVRRSTSLPVCVGFGISSPEQAGAVARLADGVIVGSACVRAVGQSQTPAAAAAAFARSFHAAVHGE
jgi:tryptophan synthase alpha chain